MPRDLPHFHLRNLGRVKPFKAKGAGGSNRASDVPNRAGHAQLLLRAIDALPSIKQEGLPGVYLEVIGRPNESLKRDSLDSSGLTLLSFDDGGRSATNQESATVFASEKALTQLRKKVDDFENKTRPDKINKAGKLVVGRAFNADLVQSVEAIREAALRVLWRSPQDRFPNHADRANWEIWLGLESAEPFIQQAQNYGVTIGADRLEFPEDIVVIAQATQAGLSDAIRRLGGVRAIAAPTVTAEFFDGMDVDIQAQWVDELLQRTTYQPHPNPGFVTLLDTGVSRSHPLINPVLDIADRHAADFAWGVEDIKGHGTQMAGLALYGDLTLGLQQRMPVFINYRLESVKLMPDVGANLHHLLGAVTRNAVDVVEQTHPRRRTYVMACTTGEDTPHDGAPTSWSSEIDQLTSGASGQHNDKRMMLISAGNTDNYTFGAGNYLDICDHENNEIESPAQSWNALCVGAYTEKAVLPPGTAGQALAPIGDLSPSSRTASWTSHWPLKPDVVFEGGNWINTAMPPPMRHGWLSLLSTHHQYPLRSLTYTYDTSAATALAAKCVTELWSDYPALWPETVRGLFVSSARWTPQMLSHLPANPSKGQYASLFQRYGYGVPDLARAKRSATNALTLLVEDTIIPYSLSEKTGDAINKDMKVFTLPWPVEQLRLLNEAMVTLRITLSTFISPNPSEAARGSKFRYASHNLRFKLNHADENEDQFLARISKVANQPDGPQTGEEDGWDYGSNRRDVGSLHIDQITCKASDLARRNLIAVHPVAGWWKSKHILEAGLPEPRFALIVEIDAEELNAQLYTEVKNVIALVAAAQNVIVM